MVGEALPHGDFAGVPSIPAVVVPAPLAMFNPYIDEDIFFLLHLVILIDCNLKIVIHLSPIGHTHKHAPRTSDANASYCPHMMVCKWLRLFLFR